MLVKQENTFVIMSMSMKTKVHLDCFVTKKDKVCDNLERNYVMDWSVNSMTTLARKVDQTSYKWHKSRLLIVPLNFGIQDSVL